MSLVRSLKKEEIDPEPSLSWLGEHLGFLRDEHHMNVGLTRARRGLCIIGEQKLRCWFLYANEPYKLAVFSLDRKTQTAILRH